MTRSELMDSFDIIRSKLKGKRSPAFGKTHDLIKQLAIHYNEPFNFITFRAKQKNYDNTCQICNNNLVSLIREYKLTCKDCWDLRKHDIKKDIMLKRWESKEYRMAMSEQSKNMWTNDLHVNKMKELRSDPVFKEKQSKITSDLWKTKEYSDKCLHNGFKKKEYVFPSGKTILVQGYESKALDELLITYKESNIIAGNELSMRIEYEHDHKLKTYLPDIFLPNENLIIEVKSRWFFDLEKDKNFAKQLACEKAGYKFEFKIYDKI